MAPLAEANTMIQYCEITEDLVSYMIDDAPAKTGFFTPGSHLEIFPSSILLGKDAPDYVLVFAWSFFDEILKRNKNYIKAGGRMILPLPKVKVYPENEYNDQEYFKSIKNLKIGIIL